MPMLVVNALWYQHGVKANGLQQLKVVTLDVNLKKVQGSLENLLYHLGIAVVSNQILKSALTGMMH
jgi:hypothetical protein